MTDQTPPAAARPLDELQVALTAARLANPVIDAPDGRRHVILPDGYQVRDISSPHMMPPYVDQKVGLDNAESMIAYLNRFSDERTIILADIDTMSIAGRLDWHFASEDTLGGDQQLQAQHAKHRATFTLRTSEELARWKKFEGELHDQMVFAEFLDENACDIVVPDPATMIEIARDLEATQGVSFKASTRLQTGERSLSYETETHVKGDLKVPTRFTLSIPLFRGEAPVDVECSFRFRPTAAGLKLGFVWRRLDYRLQAEFEQIAFRIAERTGCPLMMGRAP